MPAGLSSPRARWLVAAACYAVVAVAVGVRRGGDLAVHLDVAHRWLAQAPLYPTGPRLGVWWPPAAIALAAPFALLGETLGKGAWALASVVLLAVALPSLPRQGWRPLLLALLALAVPFHRNTEDLNLNGILVALLAAAAWDLDAKRDLRAGLWLGLATALKLFPGLAFLWLLWRGRWRALAAGAAAAVLATALAVLPYGPAGAVAELRAWFTASSAVGWGILGSNQSLAALGARLHLPLAGVAVLDAFAFALAVLALRRAGRMGSAAAQLGVVMLLAVLCSPIAWVHYFLLALPAWMVAIEEQHGWGTPARAALVALAGVMTSGLLTVFSLALRDEVWALSLYTWGALLLLALLAFPPAGAEPQPILSAA